MRKNILLSSVIVVVALAACGKEADEPMVQSAAPEVAQSPAPPSPGAPGPISSHGEEVPAAPAAVAPGLGRLSFDVPAAWKSETPKSDMRLAQGTIPGGGGPGNFAVFYFGPGGGGGLEDNIGRWIAQMQPRPGYEPLRDKFEANNCLVTWIEIEGTLLPSQTGMGPTAQQPNSVLLAAVVEGVGGPWFFKATGPAQTMKGQREAFLAMLRTVRAQ
jgi:hypothetical protein